MPISRSAWGDAGPRDQIQVQNTSDGNSAQALLDFLPRGCHRAGPGRGRPDLEPPKPTKGKDSIEIVLFWAPDTWGTWRFDAKRTRRTPATRRVSRSEASARRRGPSRGRRGRRDGHRQGSRRRLTAGWLEATILKSIALGRSKRLRRRLDSVVTSAAEREAIRSRIVANLDRGGEDARAEFRSIWTGRDARDRFERSLGGDREPSDRAEYRRTWDDPGLLPA